VFVVAVAVVEEVLLLFDACVLFPVALVLCVPLGERLFKTEDNIYNIKFNVMFTCCVL
jgi:hypothetical protein